MTGRDLIIYILQNGLEDEPVVENGKIIGFLTIAEAAQKMGVGTATILTYVRLGKIENVEIGSTIYIPANFDLKLAKEMEQV